MAFNHELYMKNIAESSKYIAHLDSAPRFFRVSSIASMDELLANLNQAAGTILMVHDNPEGVVGDGNQTENYQDQPYFVFYVAGAVERFNDSDEIKAVKDHCKTVGLKILGKMLHDKSHGNRELQFLKLSRVPYQTIGPFANGWYGVMFSFSVSEHATGLLYNAEDWS